MGGIRLVCLCPSFAKTDIIKDTDDRVQGAAIATAVIGKYDLMT